MGEFRPDRTYKVYTYYKSSWCFGMVRRQLLPGVPKFTRTSKNSNPQQPIQSGTPGEVGTRKS